MKSLLYFVSLTNRFLVIFSLQQTPILPLSLSMHRTLLMEPSSMDNSGTSAHPVGNFPRPSFSYDKQ